MSNIEIRNMSFSYDNHHEMIFDDVTLNINTNWRLGLIGTNGKGKTTLLRILMGELEPSGIVNHQTKFQYFPFDVDGAMIVKDVIETINIDVQEWEIERELNLLDVNLDVIDRPFSSLSNGEQTKVMLVALFLQDNVFLLIDEPTNHLDIDSRKTLANYLKMKKGFILVSHDRRLLNEVVNHVISINKSSVDLLKGNYETWAEEKLKKEKDEVVQNEKLTKDIKRLKEATKRTGEWSDRIEKSKMARGNGGEIPVDRGFVSHKASKMMKKSKSTQARQEKAMEAKKDLLLDVEVAPKLSMEPEQYHSKTLIRMKDIEISYGERVVLSDVSFDINRGECVALMGPNGSGKSSLFKLLLNEDIDYKGTLEVPESLKISYVQQDTSTLSGTLDEFVLSKGIDKTQFFTILRKLGFKRDVFEKRIEDYSQGQKKKVALAASLCSKAHLYLWDEPLNYLDVIAREQIEELIKEYQPTILLIEHDEEFINNIAQKVINL